MARKKKFAEIKAKREPVKKSINPFEVHFNKQKFNVLNRQLKADRGLPGVARAKALKKRKRTLLQEYKVLHKSNKFLDRRIGENNSAMTKEDRILARFSAERMKSINKKNIFNLADDEVLTHKGQSIAEIEKFDEPLSDEEGDVKGLDAKFVENANFGGGLLSEGKTNRASIIEQLITESKNRKAERQLAKEKTLQKTEELDAEWRELIPIVNMGQRDDTVDKKDSYDKILNELKFEPRGTPSNKLQSEAEIAEKEALRLKELEEERLRRMRGEDILEGKPKVQHRSADDLDDGFEIEEDGKFELTYDQDGNAVNMDKIEVLSVRKEPALEESNSDSEGDEEDDDEEEDEDGSDHPNEEKTASDNGGSGDEEVDDLSDLKVNSDDRENAVDSDTEADDPKEKTKRNLESIPSNPDLSGNGENEVKEPVKEKIKEKKKVSFGADVVLTYGKTSPVGMITPEELEKLQEERKKQMEQARKELPYAFEAPNTYEELQQLLKDKSVTEQAVIIERVIKCNHPSLNEKNKEKMENLFALLMQHLNDSEYSDSWSLLESLAPYLFDLTQFSPANAAYCLSEVILEKQNDFLKKKHKYPSMETFMFLKLVPLLFPTSDKRHSVTTPVYLFMSEMLHYCQVTTRRAITSGLFLITLFTEYVWLSKRIMPEVINFLCGLIHLSTPSTDLPVLLPFKKEHKFLFLHDSYSERNDLNLSMQGQDLESKPGCKIDDNFRIRSTFGAIKLIEILIEIYKELPASKLLFEPLKKQLDALEVKKYPVVVQKAYNHVSALLTNLMKSPLEPIIMEAKKPKALRLYEPSIKPVYDSKKSDLPKEKADHMKLLSKYKQEMKGAIRELRRDRQFLTKLKFKEISASDAERKRKVKEIYAEASQQQAEFNEMKRKRRR